MATRAAATVLMEAAAIYSALADSSDDEDESDDEMDDPHVVHLIANARYLHRSSVQKIGKWTPDRIYKLDSSRARRDLRLSISTFERVLQLIRDHSVFQRTPGKQEQAPVQLQFEVFLYSLQAFPYHVIAQHFGVGEGSVRKFSDRVLVALLSLERQFVVWPDGDAKAITKAYVQDLNGFKNAVGFVDGTAFKLKYEPPIDGECYFSRKSDYCFSAQIVCDHTRKIIYYQIGIPGSVHDKRALSYTKMAQYPSRFFESGEYLLGDSAYGVCFPFIVTPYKKPASSTRENNRFNYLLARARIGIEHCIGILKGRFPVLGNMGIYLGGERANERACNVQKACFILHNICILEAEEPLDPIVDADANEDADDDEDIEYDVDAAFTSDELRLIVQNDI